MPKTLLLADDSVTIQKVVGISFANEDFVLKTVDNGDDAIARAREVRPDIVLADVVMPGKNGYEVCEAIKSDPQLAHVPVLLLTGTFEAFDEERARRVGADGHITKPFEAQALVDAVKQRLAAATPRPAAAPAPAPAAAPSPNDATMQGSASGFDFLEDEHTEPSGLSGQSDSARTTVLIEESDQGSEEAFAFEASEDGEGLEIGDSELDLEPDLGDTPDLHLDDAPDARTQLVMEDDGGDTFESADTLPPRMVPAEPEEDATRVVFGEAGTLGADEGDALELASAPAPEDPFGAMDEAFGDPLAADAGDAVLDPTGARDYDVSSSDLGDPFDSQAPTAPPVAQRPQDTATPVPSVAPAGPPALPDPPGDDLLSTTTDPQIDADAFLMDADAELGAPEEPPPLPEPEPAFEPPAPAFEQVAPERPAPTSPSAAPAAGPVAAGARPDLEPLLRDQLHGTLEKIAWEAFGDMAERLVKDALERIERVAWEVIPQMAEALIQEEIRKLKGGDE